MGKITDMVFELVQPLAESMGLQLIEVQYEKKYNGMNMTIVIDKETGVDINDCEKLHRAIDEPLDQLNPTADQPYILNVSSPGIDRPLTLPWDFKKNMNKEIEVKLYSPINGKKVYVGVLVDYNEPNFTIDSEGEQYTFDCTKTAHIIPVIKF